MAVGSSESARPTRRPPHPPTVLLVVCLAQFVILANGMIVFVTLPAIQSTFGFGGSDLTWVVNSYILTYGGFLLFGGRSADMFGQRRIFLVGLATFLAASLLCGFASTKAMLLTVRAAQGIGAALSSSAALAILTSAFPDGTPRCRALATWSAVNAGSAALGLLLGGVLTAAGSWRLTFLAITAGSIGVLVLAIRVLPAAPNKRAEGIDIGGAITVTGGLVVTVYAILSGRQNGWSALPTVLAFGTSVALLTSFLMIQRGQRAPLIRLDVFRLRTLTAANITMFLVVGTPVTVLYLLTLHLQQALRYGVFETAVALLPASTAVAFGSLATRSLLTRWDPRIVLAAALVCVSFGSALLACFGPTSHYADAILPAVVVTFLGTSCAIVTLFFLATAQVPEADAGLASGLINTTTQVGSGLWLAVFSSTAAVHAGTVLGGYVNALRGVSLLALAAALAVPLLLRRCHVQSSLANAAH